MNLILRMICILSIYAEQLSSVEEKMFDRCDLDLYYKPYAKVLMKMGDKPIHILKNTGFMDLSTYSKVILCLNGPAIVYKGMELEDIDDIVTSGDPKPKAYTNGSLGVYEHDCKAISKIMKSDTMAARAGTAKVINLFEEVSGVYLIGNEADYRLPAMVPFYDDNFNHIVLSSAGAQATGNSFVMIGSIPGDGFCTTVTTNTSDGSSRTYKLKLLTQPGRITGPHVSARRGIDSALDDVFDETLTESTLWLPCHKHTGTRFKTTTPRTGAANDTNITQYQPFATFGHGTRIPIFSQNSGEETTESGDTTHRPELFCKGTCEVILSDETKALPDFTASRKCGSQVGKLTDNVCYFWQYTADVYVHLTDLNRMQWRFNIFDEMRKILQLSCPMVPPKMIILANQIVLGYFGKLIDGKDPVHEKFTHRRHTLWFSELLQNLIDCRAKAKSMNFNYTMSPTDPDEEFKNTRRANKKRRPKSSLYYNLWDNKTRNPDEFEDAPHIENRKPKFLSETYRQEYPADIALLFNDTTAVPIFYHREGIELETEFNYAIDVTWKAFATVIGYCNVFYQAKKPELFPRYYNSFYEDILEVLDPYWLSTADNELIRNVMEEYMDNPTINLWLDSCLEGAYVYSSSNTYRPPRPVIFIEQGQYVANYFLELPNDVPALSSTETNPLRNLIRSTKSKREVDSRPSKSIQKQNEIIDDSIHIPVAQTKDTPVEKEVKVQTKPKGRIMG